MKKQKHTHTLPPAVHIIHSLSVTSTPCPPLGQIIIEAMEMRMAREVKMISRDDESPPGGARSVKRIAEHPKLLMAEEVEAFKWVILLALAIISVSHE
jgi:hypothetical protein